MDEAPTPDRTEESVEAVLRDALARGDRVLADARPILRHLVANDDRGLFSDETIARIRGMTLDVAGQLLFAQATAGREPDPADYIGARQDELARALAEDGAFLAHVHTLVVEAQLSHRLETQAGIDPVLPPLLQELAADPEPAMAELAMAVLAAQARFLQHCRRMALPLRELPGDLLHRAMLVLRARGAGEAAERQLRASYDEGAGRLGLIDRLVLGLGQERVQALALDRTGLAIFASALALASRQDRQRIVLAFADGQAARLVLSMRVAGFGREATEGPFVLLDRAPPFSEGFDALAVDRAAALLAASPAGLG